jgi:hypothetical protein
LLDAVDVVEPEPTSADERTKGQSDDEWAMVGFRRANSPGHDTGVGGLIPKPRDSEGVGREEVCGSLIGRLQDVSVGLCCSHCLVVQWLRSFNLYLPSTQALSLSKVAEKIIAEDEGGTTLRKHVAQLEEVNAQLKASNAKMQKTIDSTREVVTLLRRELDEEIEKYELLKSGNGSLLEERNNAQY